VRGLGGILFDNLGLKLVSLLLAFVVYLNVYTERPATMLVTFPIEVTGLPDSLTVLRRDPASVTAEMRGTGKQLIRLRLTEPTLRLSLAGTRTGVQHRLVTPEDLPVGDPEGLEVVRVVDPAEITLEVERLVAKSVRVVPRFAGVVDGNAPPWVADPPSVRVRGPRSVVMALDSLLLEPVKVGGRDASPVTARIEAPPRGCTLEDATVTLRIARAPSAP
jgi:hypothetical protein